MDVIIDSTHVNVILSYSVFDFIIFLIVFVFGPCARLRWPSRQIMSGE